MNNSNDHNSGGDPRDPNAEPTRGDRLDALLRNWHDENREGARAMRDEMLAKLAERPEPRRVIGRIGFGRMLSAAAVLAFSVILAILFVKNTEQRSFADGGLVQVAEGGALDALDADGNTLGPCPLQHTDVKVEISGLFARTIVEQTYANPYPRTIEAVYTFPLSHRAAVDRMTMVVSGPNGDKYIEGEVKERSLARAIYEEARESGYVASLLEQERPNIFTQSVANIEPGATVRVRIATIEIAQRRNGVAEYVFPMVVGPRYIPGQPSSMPQLPEGWEVRQGVVLRAPAGIEILADAAFSASRLSQLLDQAIPVRALRNEAIDELLQIGEAIAFTAKYGNGSAERGTYFPARGLGEINGRFFFSPLGADQGTGFAGDTTQVPDASHITPMPVKPSERAGHDISVSVSIDSGGPAITDVSSELHAVSVESRGTASRTVTLDDQKTIPNRDFILRWKVADAAIEPSFFAHVSDSTDTSVQGGYFALMLEPPARVAPAEIRPRELVFVLDVSGSMNGFPIEKSKALARKAIASMRPNDTFNIITFAGATSVLWPEPKTATEENRRIADEFVEGAYGSGGTEMMAAINAALVQEGRSGLVPGKLLDLPADGRAVKVAAEHGALVRSDRGWTLDAGAGRGIPVEIPIAVPANPRRLALILDGNWETRDGERLLAVRTARFEDADARTRFVFFLTDGYIGNDQGVIAAIRDNARASRVFSFGIGNSINRYLLDEMARAGRGACEFVTLADDADPIIERLVRRIESPVLTDITLSLDPALGMTEVLPSGGFLPDLYDQEPMVLLGRFPRAAEGEIVVRGRTGAGDWERRMRVRLPASETAHDVVPTLWARAKVDEILAPHLAAVESQSLDARTKQSVVRLGESYSIATPYTSFVAVEKSRVVVGGKPMLVAVPVELPDGTNWNGFFGEGVRPIDALAGEGRAEKAPVTQQLGFEIDRLWFEITDARTDLNFVEQTRFFEDASLATADGIAKELAVGQAVRSAAPSAELPAPVLRTGGSMNRGEILPSVTPPSTRDSLVDAKPGAASGRADASADSLAGRRRPGAPINPRERAQAATETRSSTQGGIGGATGGLVGSGAGGGFGGGGGSNAPAPSSGGTWLGRSAQGGASDEGRQADRMMKQQADPAAEPAGDADAFGVRESETAARAAVSDPVEAVAKPALTLAERDRLVRVLDRRLVLLALAHVVGKGDQAAALAAELGVSLRAGRVLVAIRVATDESGAVDAALLDALRADGLVIEAQDAARGLVVARIDTAGLVALALRPQVRRVEVVAER